MTTCICFITLVTVLLFLSSSQCSSIHPSFIILSLKEPLTHHSAYICLSVRPYIHLTHICPRPFRHLSIHVSLSIHSYAHLPIIVLTAICPSSIHPPTHICLSRHSIYTCICPSMSILSPCKSLSILQSFLLPTHPLNMSLFLSIPRPLPVYPSSTDPPIIYPFPIFYPSINLLSIS